MSAVDIVLMAVIAVALYLAVRRVLKDKKSGKTCSGDCASCVHSCKKH